jgi:hypothetical protein
MSEKSKLAPYTTYIYHLQNGSRIKFFSDNGVEFYKSSKKWREWFKKLNGVKDERYR